MRDSKGCGEMDHSGAARLSRVAALVAAGPDTTHHIVGPTAGADGRDLARRRVSRPDRPVGRGLGQLRCHGRRNRRRTDRDQRVWRSGSGGGGPEAGRDRGEIRHRRGAPGSRRRSAAPRTALATGVRAARRTLAGPAPGESAASGGSASTNGAMAWSHSARSFSVAGCSIRATASPSARRPIGEVFASGDRLAIVDPGRQRRPARPRR